MLRGAVVRLTIFSAAQPVKERDDACKHSDPAEDDDDIPQVLSHRCLPPARTIAKVTNTTHTPFRKQRCCTRVFAIR
jgi:hypothetical protein